MSNLKLKTYYFIGISLGTVISGLYLTKSSNPSILAAILLLVWTIAGCIYPEFSVSDDHIIYPEGITTDWSKIGDRTHRIPGVLFSIVPFLIWAMIQENVFYNDASALMYMVAFFVGELVHLLLDSLTIEGIPIARRKFAIGLIRPGVVERIFCFVASTVLLLQGAYLWSTVTYLM